MGSVLGYGLEEGDINELELSPKAHQLVSAIKMAVGYDVVLKIASLPNIFRVFVYREDCTRDMNLYETMVVGASGDVGVIKYTNMDSHIRGRGIYSLGAGLRDRVALKSGFKRLVSTIRADNSRMVKAAKKDGWVLVS